MLGMTVDARAGETLTANRLNGHFQSRLHSLYNLCFHPSKLAWTKSCIELAHLIAISVVWT